MKQFKKRTIALVLASVVTVAGAFGANNYKNTIMSLDFRMGKNNDVLMILQTKSVFNKPLSVTKKDANTHVLILPDINCTSNTPNLVKVSGHVQDVNIRTMPYTNTGNGYTKITIKTAPETRLVPLKQVYVPKSNPQPELLDRSSETARNEQKTQSIASQAESMEEIMKARMNVSSSSDNKKTVNNPQKSSQKQQSQPKVQAKVLEPKVDSATESSQFDETLFEEESNNSSGGSSENLLLLLSISLVMMLVVYFYVRGRNKLREIAGEGFDLDDNKPMASVKETVKKLDKKYSNNIVVSGLEKSKSIDSDSNAEESVVKPVEELPLIKVDNIVETQEIDEEENLALEEFLSGFSFDEEFYFEELAEVSDVGYDVAYYEKVMNNKDLVFSKTDVECINKLLSTEINDSTLKNIEEYAVSNPIKKVPTKSEILENIVTTYAVSQNITFTKEDISIINKLMNVEIDSDFITDLRTNPEKTQRMEREIKSQTSVKPKPSEILTLNVKDMLPDLSEELRKQGDKKVESNAQPEIIYYSEGYEVNKLKIKDMLPDLSKEIHNKSAYVSMPKEKIQYAENNWEVERFKSIEGLPDLADVLANPDKYVEPEPEEVVVDAESLLNSISNVQFKPFDEGRNDFEVINDIEELQKEFSQFDNFVITEEEVYEQVESSNEYDDFESLYNNEYVDLDEQKKEEVKTEVETPPEDLKLEEKPVVKSESPIVTASVPPIKTSEEPSKRAVPTQDVLKRIEARRRKPMHRIRPVERRSEFQRTRTSTISPASGMKCIIDDVSYTVVSDVSFENNKGCYLAKNDSGYVVLGYIGENLVKLKSFQTLKSEKLQARVSETFADGTSRYLVRIGLVKFILDVKNDIKFVMDLC